MEANTTKTVTLLSPTYHTDDRQVHAVFTFEQDGCWVEDWCDGEVHVEQLLPEETAHRSIVNCIKGGWTVAPRK